MSVGKALATPTIFRPWSDDEVAVLAHCVSVGASSEHGADVLGITMSEYRAAIGVFDLRRKPPQPGTRKCLMCDMKFRSEDVHYLRCCDPCKETDEWRSVTPWVRL